MPHRGPGRPKRSRRASAVVTRRVRRLIDLAHDGNVKQASEETGIPYPTLRDLYSGRRSSPRLRTIKALADHYLLAIEWFTDENQGDPVPVGGFVGRLGPAPGTRGDREVLIPFAAWEFIKVAKGLGVYLDSLPATPDRAIVGDADYPEDIKRLTTLLLQPLLAAEALGEPDAVLSEFPDREDRERWVAKLRVLGRMWTVVLAKTLGASPEGRAATG